MMENWLIWLIVMAILVIVELLTSLIATFCLAVGCLCAMMVSLVNLGLEAQLIALIIGTIVSFAVFAPKIRRWQKSREVAKGTPALSNMDALKGRVVDVIEDIPANGVGRVKVDGDRWQARSNDGCPISQGAQVRITGYDSIILSVERL
ncbi:MAG: NfeD family protein [Muribaculaceae bacterium]|nr:NfeD family protein [Muribaculaceae bacterium]